MKLKSFGIDSSATKKTEFSRCLGDFKRGSSSLEISPTSAISRTFAIDLILTFVRQLQIEKDYSYVIYIKDNVTLATDQVIAHFIAIEAENSYLMPARRIIFLSSYQNHSPLTKCLYSATESQSYELGNAKSGLTGLSMGPFTDVEMGDCFHPLACVAR